LIPDSAELPERQLFECDLSIVLKLLKAEKSDLLAASASSLWRTALALQRVKVSDSDKGLTLSDLSAALGVSSNHLGRVFHQQSGISFRKYLLAARMFRAATLLRSSPLALKQVASTLGYSDESNFCRDFRKAFGKSAISYRLQPSVREELQVSSLA